MVRDTDKVRPQGRAEAARRVHCPKVEGSIPSPATKEYAMRADGVMVVVLPKEELWNKNIFGGAAPGAGI